MKNGKCKLLLCFIFSTSKNGKKIKRMRFELFFMPPSTKDVYENHTIVFC